MKSDAERVGHLVVPLRPVMLCTPDMFFWQVVKKAVYHKRRSVSTDLPFGGDLTFSSFRLYYME
jgi:hypothetical protein